MPRLHFGALSHLLMVKGSELELLGWDLGVEFGDVGE